MSNFYLLNGCTRKFKNILEFENIINKSNDKDLNRNIGFGQYHSLFVFTNLLIHNILSILMHDIL